MKEMPDAKKNFTEMSNEEIMSEFEHTERLHLAIRRTQSQLDIHYQCPGLILWTKDEKQLRGKVAIKYLEEKLTSLIKGKVG